MKKFLLINTAASGLYSNGDLPTTRILKAMNNGEIPDGKKILVIGGEDVRDYVSKALEEEGFKAEEVLMSQVGNSSHNVSVLLEEARELLDLEVFKRMLEPDPSVLQVGLKDLKIGYEGMEESLMQIRENLGCFDRAPGLQESPGYSKRPPRILGRSQKGTRTGWKSS